MDFAGTLYIPLPTQLDRRPHACNVLRRDRPKPRDRAERLHLTCSASGLFGTRERSRERNVADAQDRLRSRDAHRYGVSRQSSSTRPAPVYRSSVIGGKDVWKRLQHDRTGPARRAGSVDRLGRIATVWNGSRSAFLTRTDDADGAALWVQSRRGRALLRFHAGAQLRRENERSPVELNWR